MHDVMNIIGAEEHNLKKIDVKIPRNKLVVITGVSGSGKSSLAFNTLYAEGQRRYVESLSTYARQFIGQMNKPIVERIDGLSPSISIEQKTIGRNPRSTVGTITEIYDYYRLMYARIGIPYDPDTNKPLEKQTIDEIIDHVMEYEEGTKLVILAPVVINKKGTHAKLFEDARRLGFSRARVNGEMVRIDEDELTLEKNNKHSIEIVTGRVVISDESRKRIVEAFEKALEIGKGNACAIFTLADKSEKEKNFSLNYAYSNSELSVPELEPQLFSFNSPIGSCKHCLGIGYTTEFDEDLVIPDYGLSFYDNGIAPISENWNWYTLQIEALAKNLKEDLYKPFSQWKKSSIQQLLYGSMESIQFVYGGSTGVRHYDREFAGIMRDLQRRYQTTTDSSFREWLEQFMQKKVCPQCAGGRLRKEALNVRIKNKAIHELSQLSVNKSVEFFEELTLNERDEFVAKEILKEIRSRLYFLKEVGLGYLSLDRYAGTLSGGESQRIRLASQIGSALVGVMYVLDEPTIGLHQKDNERLLRMLLHLRDLGNTVLVVEHDEQAMNMADYIIDIGPKAGKNGGEIVGIGTPQQIRKKKTLTGKYLSGNLYIPIPENRRKGHGNLLVVKKASEHNLKNIDVSFPLGTLSVVTGVSGSGKSTLLQDIIYPAVHNKLYSTKMHVSKFGSITGLEHINKVIDIDQAPIGRTPRSNPATYVKLFDGIRALFAELPESRAMGYSPGRFSFNVRGGRCEACQGAGEQIIEMHFLSDVYVTCEVCKGKRFNRETLDIYYRGKNIYDVLCMTVDEAVDFFQKNPSVYKKLSTLQQVGMGYITLGQSAVTLSGGEAQRIKLALELSKQNTGNTLYLLDEPTTGLHQADIINLMGVLHELVDRGNTVILIEHNLEVISQADYILDLGPEGGEHGGEVVCFGAPEEVMKEKKSYTGKFLLEYIKDRNNK